MSLSICERLYAGGTRASFQRQQHIDFQLHALAQRQAQSRYGNIWMLIFKSIFLPLNLYRRFFLRCIFMPILAFLWQIIVLPLNWLSVQTDKWPCGKAERRGYSQPEARTSVWVYFVMTCPLFSLQLLICLLLSPLPSFHWLLWLCLHLCTF